MRDSRLTVSQWVAPRPCVALLGLGLLIAKRRGH